ncbi:MAG: chemotaxis protein CheD [Desulforhopalus sp.]|nr:chemotaxis protein CheD [Desulforhopalus sp.]
MRRIAANHCNSVYLKPGEVIISQNPILVSTILGSCIAVTLFSPSKKIGAICHAMYPRNPIAADHTNVHYVDTAIAFICKKMFEYTGKSDLIVKLFGGAKVLAGSEYGDTRKSIGDQNILQAKIALAQFGMAIATSDIGGSRGRKLLFSMMTGDVYLRRLRLASNTMCIGE